VRVREEVHLIGIVALDVHAGHVERNQPRFSRCLVLHGQVKSVDARGGNCRRLDQHLQVIEWDLGRGVDDQVDIRHLGFAVTVDVEPFVYGQHGFLHIPGKRQFPDHALAFPAFGHSNQHEQR